MLVILLLYKLSNLSMSILNVVNHIWNIFWLLLSVTWLIRKFKAIYSYLRNYHFHNLSWTRFAFFTFRKTFNCETIVLGFNDIENYWYSNFKCCLVWIVCIQVFIDFILVLLGQVKLLNACCYRRLYKIKTLIFDY